MSDCSNRSCAARTGMVSGPNGEKAKRCFRDDTLGYDHKALTARIVASLGPHRLVVGGASEKEREGAL